MKNTPFYILAQELLAKQQDFSKQLLALLRQEYKTLSTHNAENLELITIEKQPLIVEIDRLNQEWLSVLQAQSVELNTKSISAYLREYDLNNNTDIHKSWQELQTLAKDCKKSNTVNGTIIALRQQSAQQTLAILRGQLPGDNIYNPQGNNEAGYASGTAIAKA